jgi:alkanesulfonate monooxygenase SsuD/methylene tetrahydromethanopterin reductase-like flavin-dependent oxidoreductase (luciferase family)
MAGIGCFISAGRSLDSALERVRRADELGFDAVYTTHIAARDSVTLLMAYASASERIGLGTGVVPIFSRGPAAMAQSAATVDECSGGRMILGLGVSHQVTVENLVRAADREAGHADARVRDGRPRDSPGRATSGLRVLLD